MDYEIITYDDLCVNDEISITNFYDTIILNYRLDHIFAKRDRIYTIMYDNYIDLDNIELNKQFDIDLPRMTVLFDSTIKDVSKRRPKHVSKRRWTNGTKDVSTRTKDVILVKEYIKLVKNNRIRNNIKLFCTQIIYAKALVDIHKTLNYGEIICELDSNDTDIKKVVTILSKDGIQTKKKLRVVNVTNNEEIRTLYKFELLFVLKYDNYNKISLTIKFI